VVVNEPLASVSGDEISGRPPIAQIYDSRSWHARPLQAKRAFM
jgi:hypothetical protein